jgi:hypothetical protein
MGSVAIASSLGWKGWVVRLVLEATVLVLAEERETHGGQGVSLEELEALFESVIDFDLAGAVEDDDAAGSVWRRRVSKGVFSMIRRKQYP